MFIEQAFKGINSWWRFILLTFCTLGIFIANFIAFFSMSKEQLKETYQSMQEMPNTLSLLFNLSPFILFLGGLFLLVHKLHNRNILSLTTSKEKVDYKRFFFSFSVVVFFSLTTFCISYFIDSSTIILNFNPIKFSVLFILSLIFFPFQVGFEEYLFRGYLMQQIGIIAKNRWIPFVITSVLFGLFHSANPEVFQFGYGILFFYIGTGFLLGIVTLMDESLELALGFHLGNNMMAALLITSDYAAIQTDALFRFSGSNNQINILTEMIITIVIVYPIILIIFAKKYRWTNWKTKLFGKIQSYSNTN